MHLGHPPMQQEETLPRRYPLDTVPVLGIKDIPTTMLRVAMAGLWGLIIQLVAVVVGEFLACLNIPDRHNPDGVAELFGVAVWVTRMVDKACCVLGYISIDGITLIQADDIDVACG